MARTRPATRASRATTRQRRPSSAQVRFLLRLPTALHEGLAARAASLGLSLNEYCVRRLGAPEPPASVLDSAGLFRRAEAVAGSRLAGLLVHGSVVRGEARTSSDLDVLIVVDTALPLTRSLYRAWDEGNLAVEGTAIDAHFVHLPSEPERAGSVWCEAAVEGLLLWDRDGRVQQTLVTIRRAIAGGRLVRRQLHGQPYWTVAA
ncbi:MAG: toxin-antitoxin system HicB family antitoxin [Vicinamibacterales bacterium]